MITRSFDDDDNNDYDHGDDDDDDGGGGDNIDCDVSHQFLRVPQAKTFAHFPMLGNRNPKYIAKHQSSFCKPRFMRTLHIICGLPHLRCPHGFQNMVSKMFMQVLPELFLQICLKFLYLYIFNI